MSNKSKKNKPAAAEPTTDAPAKKKRKPADPNKVKLPWAQRQTKLTSRLIKILGRLAGRLKKHTASGVDASLADDALACVTAIDTALTSEAVQTYKPAVRGKVGDGATIKVKSDPESLAAPVFTRIDPRTGAPYLNPALFTGAVVIGDERTAWMVSCADGATRLISKKLVELA